jgi:hypothetical protein
MQMTSVPPSVPSQAPTPVPSEELARDIAQQLLTPDEICDKHGVTKSGIKRLGKDPGFRVMVAQHRADWLASESVDERVRIKAKMAEESLLIDMHEIVKNPMSANADRIAATKVIQVSSGVTRAAPAQVGIGGGAGIQLTINLDGTPLPAMTFEQVVTEVEEPDELDYEEEP